MGKLMLWGKESSLSEFPFLAKGELQRILAFSSLLSRKCESSVAYGHYKNAVKSCGLLYENASAIGGLFNEAVLESVRTLIRDAKPFVIERDGSVTRISFNGMLPIRYFYGRESAHVRDFFQNPLRNALYEARNDGKLKFYDGKIVVCFLNYFAEGSCPIDYHDFEVKPVIDCMKQFLFRDDDPSHLAICSRSLGAERTRTEICLVPYDEFRGFLNTPNRELTPRRNATYSGCENLKMTVFGFAREILDSSERLIEAFNERKWNEVAMQYSRLLLSCGRLLDCFKLSAYETGVGDVDLDGNLVNNARITMTSAEEGFVRYRLDGLIDKFAKGADKRKHVKRIPISMFKEIEKCAESFSNGMSVSFIHHFGKESMLIDHDNIATLPYARAILASSAVENADYYMDCVSEDKVESFTEIIVSARDKLPC